MQNSYKETRNDKEMMQNNDWKTQNEGSNLKEMQSNWNETRNDHIKMLNNCRNPKLPKKDASQLQKHINQPQWDVKNEYKEIQNVQEELDTC